MPKQYTEFEPGDDTALVCADCGRDFLFSSDEQAYFFERGLAKPKRCNSCRMARKSKYSKRGNW